MNTVSFSVEDYNNIHTLPLGSSLADFMEFDFKPFYIKCCTLAEVSLQTKEYDEKDAVLIKDLIRSCHPYVTACYNGVFNDVVLDCVIEVICRTQRLSLEALWAQNISSNDSLGKAVFTRISEYKVGRAINQWANLQRMQSYAIKKTGFVFAQDNTTKTDCELRATYFDLAFSTAARLAGCELAELPHIQCRTAAMLPGAAELLSPVTSLVEPTVQSILTSKLNQQPANNGCIMEQYSGLLCEDLLKLPLPEHLEMVNISEKLKGLPRRVYIATGLKAIIDLELEELLSRDLMLWLSPESGRWLEKSIVRLPNNTEKAFDEQMQQELAAEGEEPPKAEEKQKTEIKEPAPEKRKAKSTETAEEKADKQTKAQGKAAAPKAKPEAEKTLKAEKAESKPKASTPKKSADKGKDTSEKEPSKQPKAKEKQKSEALSDLLPQKPKSKQKTAQKTIPEPSASAQPERKEKTSDKSKPSANPQESILPDNITIEPPKEQPAVLSEEIIKPATIEERMIMLQDLAADKLRPLRQSYDGQDVDVLCQSVNTALQVALKDEWEQQETEIWAKHLFRIRGGIMSRKFSRQYLFRFLEATIQMYKLDI